MQLSGHLGAVSESDFTWLWFQISTSNLSDGKPGNSSTKPVVSTQVSVFSTFELFSDSVRVKGGLYSGFTAPNIGRSSGLME